jgi:hypothetical protein
MKFRLRNYKNLKKKLFHSTNKSFKEAYLYVISRIMKRVRERLNTGLDSTYHVVNNFYVSRFTESNQNKT